MRLYGTIVDVGAQQKPEVVVLNRTAQPHEMDKGTLTLIGIGVGVAFVLLIATLLAR